MERKCIGLNFKKETIESSTIRKRTFIMSKTIVLKVNHSKYWKTKPNP
jgi:hypothetical protein